MHQKQDIQLKLYQTVFAKYQSRITDKTLSTKTLQTIEEKNRFKLE